MKDDRVSGKPASIATTKQIGVNVARFESRKVMIGRTLANSRFDLDVSQMTIFLCTLGKLPQSKPLNRDTWHEVTAEEYALARKITIDGGKLALERAVEDLWDSAFYVIDPNTGVEVMNRWIISLKPTDSGIAFKFHPDIVPFICELDTYFTASLLAIGGLAHKMAYTIYFLIMGNRRFHKQKAGAMEILIEDFLANTGLVGTSYANYSTLRSMLLLPAIKELLAKRLFLQLELSRKRGSPSFTIIWKISEEETMSSLGRA